MNNYKISALGRPVDLSYASNKRIAQIAPAGFLLYFIYSQDIWLSLLFAANLFLVWALNRELDPDNHTAAVLSVLLYGLLSPFIDLNTSLLTLFWLLLLLRSLSLCVGLTILISDYLLIAVFSVIIARQNEHPLFLIMTFIAFLYIWFARREKNIYGGLLVTAAGLIWFCLAPFTGPYFYISGDIMYFATLFVSILFLWWILQNKAPESYDDQGKEPIMQIRLLVSQYFFLLYTLIVNHVPFMADQKLLLTCVMAGSLLIAIYPFFSKRIQR